MRWLLPLLLLAVACSEDPYTSDDAAVRLKAVATLGASPAGVPLLIDMLDDDDDAVRKAAAEALAELGRKGLAVHARYLAGNKFPAFYEIGRTALALGATLTSADLASAMQERFEASAKRAGAASSIAAGNRLEFADSMVDVLGSVIANPDAKQLAGASLSVIGWAYASKEHPATAKEVAAHVKLIEAPVKSGEEWTASLAACVITLVLPRDQWPKETHAYMWAREDDREIERPSLTDLRTALGKLAQSAPREQRGYDRRGKLDAAIRALRAYGPEAGPLADDVLRLLRKEGELARVELAGALSVVSKEHRPMAAKELGARLLRTKDHRVHHRALTLLAALGPDAQPAVPALVAVLGWSEAEDGGDDDLGTVAGRLGAKFWLARRAKRAVATLLGKIGRHASDAKPALAALRGHKDARLRYRVATALRRIG